MAKSFWVEAIEKNDPQLLEHMTAAAEFVRTDGALSAKVKTLMGLFGDAMLNHSGGVKALAAQARSQGATEEEINETVRMAFLWSGVPGLVIGTYAYPEQE